MKKLIFKISLCLIFLTTCISCTKAQHTTIQEGDIIFQTSQSKQSPLIAYATFSNKTHCGIIVEKNDKLYVLETLSTIKLTPLQDFINRGLNKKYWIKRGVNAKIDYKKYLGIPYDLAFKPNNSKYYCSELVYTIYLEQFNIKLCDMNPIKDYNLLGIEDVMTNRGMNKNQLVVSPSDIYNSKYLKSINAAK